MIIVPPNSFVQKASVPVTDCRDYIPVCLPVCDKGDVAFQFSDDTPNGATRYYIQLMQTDGTGSLSIEKDMVFTNYFGTYVVYLPELPAFTYLAEGTCFKIRVYRNSDTGTGTILFDTNCFYYTSDKCWTSKITYITDELSAFGFTYGTYGFFPPHRMANKIRLPFYLSKPQSDVVEKVFVKSDGSRKQLSGRFGRVFEGITDKMNADWHSKLSIALKHDQVFITNLESEFTDQGISQEGAYNVLWDDVPATSKVAQAKFKAYQTPYLNVNSNCQNAY